jgi:hypothetical protein
LISPDNLESNIDGITSVVRSIGTQSLLSSVAYNLDVDRDNTTAVNPLMRSSIFNIFIGLPITYQHWTLATTAQEMITREFLSDLEDLTPRGGSYLNEADFQQPDFQSAFYGGL